PGPRDWLHLSPQRRTGNPRQEDQVRGGLSVLKLVYNGAVQSKVANFQLVGKLTLRDYGRVARHAFRICLVPKPVKYNLTSCLKSPVTRARFQTRSRQRRICANSTESEKQCAGTITSEFPLLKRSLARPT